MSRLGKYLDMLTNTLYEYVVFLANMAAAVTVFIIARLCF